MIFYFSATGNSKYVAECIRTEGETLISIADATDKKEYNYPIHFINLFIFKFKMK